jgi:competence protein ComEC
MGGLFRVLESFSAEKIYDNGEKIAKNPTCDLYRWYAEFIRKSDNYGSLKKGDDLKLGDARLEVLWPDEGFEGNWNENSLVIMVREGGKKILLMGDVPARVEGLLVKEHGGALRADILKVGHHGAAGATSADFLEAVRPKWAVISTDKDNIRGYPSKKVIKRLKNQGVKIYKTYEDGDIRFSGNKKFRILTVQ